MCNKYGHIALECYHRFNPQFQPPPSSHTPQTHPQLGSGQAPQAYLAEPVTSVPPHASSASQALVATPATVYDPLWYPDSGASNHLAPDSSIYSFKHPYEGSNKVQVGNGSGMNIMHMGHSTLHSHSFNKSFILHNLLHVPGLTKNLLSVSQFAKQNHVFFEFHSDACYVKCQDSKEILLHGITKDGLYVFPDLVPSTTSQNSSQHPLCPNKNALHSTEVVSQHTSKCINSSAFYSNRLGTAKTDNFLLWHSRLGHSAGTVVHKVLQFCRIPFDKNKISMICIACCLGKHHQLPFALSTSVYSEPLERIYSDIWGPSPMSSSSGARYYITFMDAFSKHTWFYLLNQKSQALSTFVQFKTLVENQLGKKIKAIQTDNAKEFLAFSNYLNECGIFHRLTCPYTHEQNGSIERKHRHITSTRLTLLAHASLPLTFWGESFYTATHLINLLPT